MTPSPLLLRGATAIVVDAVTERAGDLILRDGRVADDGTVPGTTAGLAPPTALDVSGCVITPGLVNAHHHLLQSAFRTLPGTRAVAMTDWLPVMARAYAQAGVDAELVQVAAAVGVAEGLLSGVTTIADHQLTWPGGVSGESTVALARAAADAARDLGGRLVFVRGAARDDPEEAAASAEAIVAALVPGAAGGVSDDGGLQVAVGPAGVHSDPQRTFTLMGEVAARHGLRRRTQANEQVDVVVARERYGARPIELLREWGWLAPDVTIAHLCDITSAEVDALAAAGVSATHAPGCDVPMGWGVAPVAQLLASGLAVGLGTSGGGSNDAGHLLADARLALQVSALVGPQLSARTVLAMATSGSAAGLGRPELGHLRRGAAADLCVWDVSGVADAGVADPVAGLIWAAPGRRPRHVVVAGELVVQDGVLLRRPERDVVTALHRRLRRGERRGVGW
ncbi:amidohydrolase family protein [Dermatophilaceae bacterium Soc4.6]